MYKGYAPDGARRGTITLRLIRKEADRKASLNRMENLRAIPPPEPARWVNSSTQPEST